MEIKILAIIERLIVKFEEGLEKLNKNDKGNMVDSGGHIFTLTFCDHCNAPCWVTKINKERNQHSFCDQECFNNYRSSAYLKGTKRCTICERELPLSYFESRKGTRKTKLVFKGECKDCMGDLKNSPEMRPATLYKRIRRTVRFFLGKGGYIKEKFTRDYVNFTPEVLRTYLEATIPDGYSWDDLPSLDIDHIYSCAFFKYPSPEDELFNLLWSLENLRLIPASENRKKGIILPSIYYSESEWDDIKTKLGIHRFAKIMDRHAEKILNSS